MAGAWLNETFWSSTENLTGLQEAAMGFGYMARLVDWNQLAWLRGAKLEDVLCTACGIFMARITFHLRGKVAMHTLCKTCQDNHRYATE